MAEQPKLDVALAPMINAGQVVGIIIILVLIIIGAYYLTKYVGYRTMTKGMRTEDAKKHKFFSFGAGSGKNEFVHMVRVVDRIPIDRDKTLMVVEFAKKRYLIGTTPEGFEKIDEVPVSGRADTARPQEDTCAHAKSEDAPRPKRGETAQSPLSDSTTAKANVNAKDEISARKTEKLSGSIEESHDRADGSTVEDSAAEDNAAREEAGNADEKNGTSFDTTRGTFGQRFKKAFGIVLQSYLPKSMRSSTQGSPARSFDEELKTRMRTDDEEDTDQ